MSFSYLDVHGPIHPQMLRPSTFQQVPSLHRSRRLYCMFRSLFSTHFPNTMPIVDLRRAVPNVSMRRIDDDRFHLVQY